MTHGHETTYTQHFSLKNWAKLYPVSNSFKNSRHLWAAHLRSCLLSHHVLPAEPISKFRDCTLLRRSSVPFLNPVSRTLPPIAACYCTTQPFISLPAFSLSLSLLATWGNDSITYDPIHLLMMFGHSKAHLRPFKCSSHSLYSLLGASTLKLILQGMCVWGGPECICVCDHPLQLFPTFLLFWDLDQFLVCLWVHVGRVWSRRAMCQEKHMVLLGYRHLLLHRWERFQNH